MPLFTVIITTHNRQAFLQEAVTSVLAQTVQDYEIVVVDDGSTPPVRTPNDPRIRVIRGNHPSGPAAARNVGMRASRGNYFVFLDDDDLFTPDRLALGQEGASRAPIGVCDVHLLDQRSHAWVNGVRMRRMRGRSQRPAISDDGGRRARFPQVGQVTILAEIAPTFDERFWVAEDIDWWIRASRSSRIVRVGGVGLIRRVYDRPRVYSRAHLEASLRSTLLVLEANDEYFALHAGAAAYRWKRIAFLYERLGQGFLAREAFRRAAEISGKPPGKWNMTRTYLPIPQRMRPRL